ncbi:MAG: hypothetical protein B6I25_04810 [Planctomycetales bacterium 4572_13]|nr:MAG: hypothetical protein B6I25_04810 [Planctomycetales bacterium 4572_13]
MNTNKYELILITVLFLVGSLPVSVVFGANYSTESAADSPGRPSKPSRPKTAKKAPQARQSPTIYSTEKTTPALVEKDPNTTTTDTGDPKAYHAKTVRREPAAPDRPRSPKAADCNGYPSVDGGSIALRPYPYLMGRDSCSGIDRDGFWPGLLGIDLSYSWSGDSGGGQFDWCGYRYTWGDDPAYRDASGFYQARSTAASDPNTTQGDYAIDSTEDSRLPDDRYSPSPFSDANELRQDVPVPERPKHKAKAAKDR